MNVEFRAAIKKFGVDLLRTEAINHRGNRGAAREGALAKFFQDRLPTRYAVVEGEVIDLTGRTSPQLDLLFYDESDNFPFNTDQTKILPAEALLASVEVKTKLTNGEVIKTIDAARKLRALQPFGKPLGGIDVSRGRPAAPRYFHCVFAYATDLAESDWLSNEYKRFQASSGAAHLVDAVYVLNRGLINLDHRIGRAEDDEGGAITNFYFSILNFIQREASRRKATPFERYTQPARSAWKKL